MNDEVEETTRFKNLHKEQFYAIANSKNEVLSKHKKNKSWIDLKNVNFEEDHMILYVDYVSDAREILSKLKDKSDCRIVMCRYEGKDITHYFDEKISTKGQIYKDSEGNIIEQHWFDKHFVKIGILVSIIIILIVLIN